MKTETQKIQLFFIKKIVYGFRKNISAKNLKLG